MKNMVYLFALFIFFYSASRLWSDEPTNWVQGDSYSNGALVVNQSGVSYIAIQDVPAEISLNNTEYWTSLEEQAPTATPNEVPGNNIDLSDLPSSIPESNSSYSGKIIFVHDIVSAGGDGTSWTFAHKYLQDVLRMRNTGTRFGLPKVPTNPIRVRE